MHIFKIKGNLRNEMIDELASKAEDLYLEATKGKVKPSPKLKLSVEETLLRIRDRFGEDEQITFLCQKSKDVLKITITYKGEPCNPLEFDEDIPVNLIENLHLDPYPIYSYKEKINQNTITITYPIPHKKHALLFKLFVAILLAVATKYILGFLPGNISTDYIQPLISEFFNKMTFLFSATATPLVFFAVINGITGLGDVVSFGQIGKRLLLRMLFTYCMAMVIMVVMGIFMGLATFAPGATGNNVIIDLIRLVLDMIPNNIAQPFVIDNDLQVIVLSIFVGVILLGLGEKVSMLKNFSIQTGNLINSMMMAVCKLMPLFVYLGVTDLILSDRLQNIYKVSHILALSLGAAALVIIITIIRTLVVTKIPFKKMMSAQLPSLIINLTTSSQVSAYPESVKCCEDKWGIDTKLVNFGLPLGVVVYMPNGAIMLGAMAWVLAVMNLGPLDIGTIIKIAFVSVVIAIAAPPIPGSAFAVMPILFSACGTDLSMMPLAVIVASTVGYLLPAMNGFCLQLELLMSAWKSDMVDKEKISK